MTNSKSSQETSKTLSFEMLNDAVESMRDKGGYKTSDYIRFPNYLMEQFHDIYILPEMTNRELLTKILASETLENRLKFKREYNRRENKNLDATRYDVKNEIVEFEHIFRCKDECDLPGCRCSCHKSIDKHNDFRL